MGKPLRAGLRLRAPMPARVDAVRPLLRLKRRSTRSGPLPRPRTSHSLSATLKVQMGKLELLRPLKLPNRIQRRRLMRRALAKRRLSVAYYWLLRLVSTVPTKSESIFWDVCVGTSFVVFEFTAFLSKG